MESPNIVSTLGYTLTQFVQDVEAEGINEGGTSSAPEETRTNVLRWGSLRSGNIR